ncbi:ComF family protein [Patescibacteria group bacterium]|nr:MAG: ComF family protein [Patescibacteria group bacterium]
MIRWLIDALFPRFCVRCKAEGATICRTCDEAVTFSPVPGDVPQQAPLDGLLCAGPYVDPTLRRLIGAWKFGGDGQGREAVMKQVRAALETASELPVDAVAWVPLHEKRLRSRGFDQAREVAEEAARALCVPCVPLLSRSVHTRPRSLVGRADRKAGDLDGIFEAAGAMPARVLLCDDVFTSGATMGAAAHALKAAGAREVRGFAVARG